jgi:hypothetical protein
LTFVCVVHLDTPMYTHTHIHTHTHVHKHKQTHIHTRARATFTYMHIFCNKCIIVHSFPTLVARGASPCGQTLTGVVFVAYTAVQAVAGAYLACDTLERGCTRATEASVEVGANAAVCTRIVD